MKTSTKIVIVLAFIVLAIIGVYSCSKNMIYRSLINTVKDGYFYEEISDVTIGDIMETICTNSKWEYTPSEETNLPFVTYTGNMDGQPLEMQFFMYNFGGTPNFRLNAFSLNGERVDNGYGLTGRDELSVVPFALYERYQRVKGR